MQVGLVTYEGLPRLTTDDQMIVPALERLGAIARPVAWSDTGVCWDRYDLLVLRSVWDYSQRYGEFLRWIGRVAGVAPVWNPVSLVSWNAHKRYLLDLQRWGIPIVPTVVVQAGSDIDLRSMMAEKDWGTMVVKPAVSADARDTHRVTVDTLIPAQAFVDRLLADQDLLIQPYRAAIGETGELSFVFVDGEFSHLVRKRPAQGDFRVQEKFGGYAEVESATPDQLYQAARVIEVLPVRPLYARVDMVARAGSELELVELELIEPSLFLDRWPPAADRLAAGIVRRMDHEGLVETVRPVG